MTQSSRAADTDDAFSDLRLPGEAARSLLGSLPAAHKQPFLLAVEAVLLGQTGVCLTGEAGSDRAAFVDQLAAMAPATQVVLARLGRAASPDDLQSALEAAGAQCPRLAHVLLAVSDAEALRRDTLDRLNTLAGDLLVRRQGLQLLLAGHPRLLDRLRVIQHENLLRYLETRLVLPALAPDAKASVAALPKALPTQGSSAARAAGTEAVRTPHLPRAGSWRPDWITGTAVVAASALLVVGGLAVAIRRTAPERVAVVAGANRIASNAVLQPAIVPPATMSDGPGSAIDPAQQPPPPPPTQLPSVLAAASPAPLPPHETLPPATAADAAGTPAPTSPSPDLALPALAPTLAGADPAPPAQAPTAPEPTPPTLALSTRDQAPPTAELLPATPDQAPPALAATAAEPDQPPPPPVAAAPTSSDQAPPALASASTAPEPARATVASGPSAPEPAPAPIPPARQTAPQEAADLGARPEPGRPAGPGLLLVAARGDTLAGLYQRIYAGLSPPPFAAVLAVNRGPVQPGARLLFPAPPGGWPARPLGSGAPQGPAKAP